MFVLWKVTGDPTYREWGWEIYENFEKWGRVEGGGYSSLKDVQKIPPGHRYR